MACRWKLKLLIGSMVKGYESREVMWFVSSIMICYLDNQGSDVRESLPDVGRSLSTSTTSPLSAIDYHRLSLAKMKRPLLRYCHEYFFKFDVKIVQGPRTQYDVRKWILLNMDSRNKRPV